MYLIGTVGSKRALRLSTRVKVLMRKAEDRHLDVEGVLGALVGSEVEDSAASEVKPVDDGEAVRRLHLVAEEASKDPAKPCRWFTEMPEFAGTAL